MPVGRLVVHRKNPHQWTEDELTSIKDTAERVWPLIQRARAEAELLEATRSLERAQRIAFLGSYRYSPARKEFILSSHARRLFSLPDNGMVTEASLLDRVHPDDRKAVTEAWVLAHAGKIVDLEYRLMADERSMWVHQRIETEFGSDGEILAVYGTVQDVSVRRELTDALRRNEERLRLALDAAKMGVWDTDHSTGAVTWSERSKTLLGFGDRALEPSASNWTAHIQPDDLASVKSRIYEGQTASKDVVVDFRVDAGGGAFRWVEAHGRSERDPTGRVARSYGVLMDITQRKFSEIQLLDSEQRFRNLFEYLPVAYQSLNPDGEWIDANQKMADLLGFSSPSEMMGLKFTDYWAVNHEGASQTPFEKLKNNNEISGQLELVRRDGRSISVMISGRVERDRDANFVRTHIILLDFTERENMEREIRSLNAELERRIEERTAELSAANVALAALARHDELTGLPNRLAANERLRLEYITMKRTGRPYAVLMADIDHFKTVNDRHGHAVGDRVLRNLAKALQGSLRKRDFVCRFGGEEFLILLPETDAAGAETVAEKARTAVLLCEDPVAGPLTVSIGIAVASPSHASEDEAVRDADERLYRAKRGGRNRAIS